MRNENYQLVIGKYKKLTLYSENGNIDTTQSKTSLQYQPVHITPKKQAELR